MKIEATNNIKDTLRQWQDAVKPAIPIKESAKEYVKNMFKNLGFTNIRVHPDGKVDATKDGYRYKGLYLSGMSTQLDKKDTVMIQKVKLEYTKKTGDTHAHQ